MTNQMTAALAVSAVCGWLIPALVDLLTKSHLPARTKALFAAVLSAVAGAVATVEFTPGQRWSTYLLAIGVAFASAMAAHQTGYSNPIQAATANFGAGPAIPAPADPLAATEPGQSEGPGVPGDPGGG